uniref:Uncharacterized protein F13E9.13, mitochondrial n=1 Tax=Lygus hesperus TaxID=30085 RepID=A0A146LZV3_LYGHE
MDKFKRLFSRMSPSIIGMVHLGALPGSPMYRGSVAQIVENACSEAEIYKNAGVHSVMLENMNDVPYIQARAQGPEVVASMTRVATEVRSLIPPEIPLGIQVLAGANKEAIAIAHSCGFNFVRAEGFVFSHIGDEGFFDACAGELLRYRRGLGADDVLVFTDIKKKHSSHQITADLDIKEVAKAAEFFISDGVIITGSSTGNPADPKEVREVKSSLNIPVLVGSGVTAENVDQFKMADALIVGSYFKEGGLWSNALSQDKILRFMDKVNSLR